ncbi:hypothetical protein KIW84_021265 [Lathyrus oleraceus]|uniref:Subtilisin-like protease fibronectin type-III domain-containing protein n=1 Tax=Pisum sativum TaxID=3888 RepID=A0A9D4YD10_PEA|nr:hypothetical protein KIW84_021265 [Pisum sativum]
MSTYRAFVTAPQMTQYFSDPKCVIIHILGRKKTFTPTINGKMKKSIDGASLIWDDGKYQVRSLIVVFDERAVNRKDEKLYRIDCICSILFYLLFYIIIG